MIVRSFDEDDDMTKVSQRLLNSDDEIELDIDDEFDTASSSSADTYRFYTGFWKCFSPLTPVFSMD
jgi:hypothetical protein